MISIIGGAGFIGSRLAKNLYGAGTEFEILDLRPSGRFADTSKIVDIRDLQALRSTLTGDPVVHLAAVHRDDVRPKSLYEETNVTGTRNLARVAHERKVKTIVFTSTVAVYGFCDPGTDESGEIAPFNEYGRTKYQAEGVLRDWQKNDSSSRTLVIIRPTVVFGEGNRGNVYNLLNQIQSGKFLMVGPGRNTKSMAYVGNVASFLEWTLPLPPGVHIFNYVDKPDFTMSELVQLCRGYLKGAEGVGFRIPSWLAPPAGFVFDLVATLTGKSLPVSSIRLRKFLSTTSFVSRAESSFRPPYALREAMETTLRHEFQTLDPAKEIFYTE